MKQRLANAHNLRKNKKKIDLACERWVRVFENVIHFYRNDLFSRTISRAINADYATCRYHEQSIFDLADGLLLTHQNDLAVKFWQ